MMNMHGSAGGIGSLMRYDHFEQVGEGTYGHVYKARDKQDHNNIVAMKRLIFHKESAGFPLFAIREIKLLKSLSHPNIVQLKTIVSSKGCEDKEREIKTETFSKNSSVAQRNVNQGGQEAVRVDGLDIRRCGSLFLVFEYMEHDLGGLIDIKYNFHADQIKVLMKQLFEVLAYLHERKIIHRDIKTSNLLVNNSLQLKLADFGLARCTHTVDPLMAISGAFGPPVSGAVAAKPELTNNVITMWYRPPELLLGELRYSFAVDIWSAGCVLGELLLGRPMFPGKTEAAQMELIVKAVGTPTEQSWPGVSRLPNYNTLIGASRIASSIKNTYEGRVPATELLLMDRLLVADPGRRMSARSALSNTYFHSCPTLEQIEHLDKLRDQSCHEFQTKLRRREMHEKAVAARQQLQVNVSVDSSQKSGTVGQVEDRDSGFADPNFSESSRVHHSLPPQGRADCAIKRKWHDR